VALRPYLAAGLPFRSAHATALIKVLVLSNGPIDTKIDTKLLAGRSKYGSSVYADSPYTGAYLRQKVGNSKIREWAYSPNVGEEVFSEVRRV
jgi:hypothetical protein